MLTLRIFAPFISKENCPDIFYHKLNFKFFYLCVKRRNVRLLNEQSTHCLNYWYVALHSSYGNCLTSKYSVGGLTTELTNPQEADDRPKKKKGGSD